MSPAVTHGHCVFSILITLQVFTCTKETSQANQKEQDMICTEACMLCAKVVFSLGFIASHLLTTLRLLPDVARPQGQQQATPHVVLTALELVFRACLQ